MAMSSEDAPAPARLSYREREVDNTLDDHEIRISRLEKVSLVVVGYALAEGGSLVNDIIQLV